MNSPHGGEHDANREKLLCFKCLAENEPFADQCVKCGNPFTGAFPTGVYGEMSTGKGGHYKMDFSPHSPLILMGVWVLFGIPFLLIPFIVHSMVKDQSPLWQFIIMVAGWLLCCFILIRYTMRYFKHNKGQRGNDGIE